ncbi:MAG: hypothetical protein P4M07_20010 [Xanthobacteraceae bacterium]|nr:hypothetical protein [Xanthobacteraceae bacterium]
MMTRRPKPTEPERRAMLESLTDVGPSKPVGYLPLYAIRDFVRLSPKAVAADAAARGLAAARFGTKQCRIKSGALYVYHREALAGLLQARADVLDAAGLPRDPDGFVAHIAAVRYEADHPVHAVIKAAFADTF